MLGLRIGILLGTPIWGLGISDRSRVATIEALNSGELHGIVMTEQVGGFGHTLVGASVMIFIGSLYSSAQEEQAIGTPDFLLNSEH